MTTTAKKKPLKISPKLAAKEKKSTKDKWTLPKYLAEQRQLRKKYKKAHPPMKLPGIWQLSKQSGHSGSDGDYLRVLVPYTRF
jgi:hypothetical protein